MPNAPCAIFSTVTSEALLKMRLMAETLPFATRFQLFTPKLSAQSQESAIVAINPPV